jgi:hypothetical protein
MKPTSHDLMRDAMARHAITADELIASVHDMLGGDRARIAETVSRFAAGGPCPLCVSLAIIDFVIQHEASAVH